MKRQMVIAFSLTVIFLSTGCEENSNAAEKETDLEIHLERLEMKNNELERQLTELKNVESNNKELKQQLTEMENKHKEQIEEDRQALRTTLNLAIKVLSAINQKDLDYIKSISSPNVQIKNNTIYTPNNIYEITKQNYKLENLEYRFYDLQEDKMIIGFANYFFEGHSTIYMEFIKVNDQWVFDSIMTDA